MERDTERAFYGIISFVPIIDNDTALAWVEKINRCIIGRKESRSTFLAGELFIHRIPFIITA